jgi:hypothetical protein
LAFEGEESLKSISFSGFVQIAVFPTQDCVDLIAEFLTASLARQAASHCHGSFTTKDHLGVVLTIGAFFVVLDNLSSVDDFKLITVRVCHALPIRVPTWPMEQQRMDQQEDDSTSPVRSTIESYEP